MNVTDRCVSTGHNETMPFALRLMEDESESSGCCPEVPSPKFKSARHWQCSAGVTHWHTPTLSIINHSWHLQSSQWQDIILRPLLLCCGKRIRQRVYFTMKTIPSVSRGSLVKSRSLMDRLMPHSSAPLATISNNVIELCNPSSI